MTQITKHDVVSYQDANGDQVGLVSSVYHDGASGVDRAAIENYYGSWSFPAISECTFIKKGGLLF